jgi:aspartyl-tRNA(Asn)/glutamyl-tRNA(Gln) amidotransferase subunit C
MSLDTKAVANIATLARIRVPEADLPGMVKELNGIMTWIEQLNEVDTTGVEPMSGVLARDLPRRPDVVNDGGDSNKVLANAPEPAHGFYTVPKVVE